MQAILTKQRQLNTARSKMQNTTSDCKLREYDTFLLRVKRKHCDDEVTLNGGSFVCFTHIGEATTVMMFTLKGYKLRLSVNSNRLSRYCQYVWCARLPLTFQFLIFVTTTRRYTANVWFLYIGQYINTCYILFRNIDLETFQIYSSLFAVTVEAAQQWKIYKERRKTPQIT